MYEGLDGESPIPVPSWTNPRSQLSIFFTIPVNCWAIRKSQQILGEEFQFPAIYLGQSQLPVKGHPDTHVWIISENEPLVKYHHCCRSWMVINTLESWASVLSQSHGDGTALMERDHLLHTKHYVCHGNSWVVSICQHQASRYHLR